MRHLRWVIHNDYPVMVPDSRPTAVVGILCMEYKAIEYKMVYSGNVLNRILQLLGTRPKARLITGIKPYWQTNALKGA